MIFYLNMNQPYLKKILTLSFLICSLLSASTLFGQVTVRYNGTATGLTTTCTDGCVWPFCPNDPERSFELEIKRVTGGNQADGGGATTAADNCSNTPNTSFSTKNAGITLYCSGAVIHIRGKAGESDAIIGCGGMECETPWSGWTNFTVLNTTSQNWGPVYVSGNGSTGNLSSTISFTGNFRANARDGNKNFSCATAWALPANGSGTPIDGHTTNCGDAWYKYTLTDNNLQYIEFEPTAPLSSLNTSEISEVRYNNCTGCQMGGEASFIGNKYRVDNPKPGDYFIRVHVFKTDLIGAFDLSFKLEVRKGSTVAVPSNDNLCDAIELSGNYNYNSGDLSASSNTKNASSEDYCGMNEPESDNEKTVWYKFTTGDLPPTVLTIDPKAGSSTQYGRAVLYKQNSVPNCNAYPTPNFFNALSKVGESTAGVSFKVRCLDPNKTYYLQLFTRQLLPLPSTKDAGPVSVTIENSGTTKGPDFICLPASSAIPGKDGYLGKLDSYDNTNLIAEKQTTSCATVSTGNGEPVNSSRSLKQTVWYRFDTPHADYSDSTLMHLYDISAIRLSSTSLLTNPRIFLYEETQNTNRACGDSNGDYANLKFIESSEEFYQEIGSFVPQDATLKDLCLKPNTKYFVRVDQAGLISVLGIDVFVDFDLVIKKSAFRPGNDICEATEMPGNIFTGRNKITTQNHARLTGAPFFGLPHSNKCASSDPGEPNVKPGAPGGVGDKYTASVWYKFTTDGAPSEWIEWDFSSKLLRGDRGDVCLLGEHFGANIFIYKSKNNTCSYPTLQIQSEYDKAWEVPPASSTPSVNRQRCPEPNTTYYVQVQDADFFSTDFSTCYEGVYDLTITTAGTTVNPPENDEPCGAIPLGTVPVSGSLDKDIRNNNKVFDNFCATPSKGFIPDPDHELKHDVWFAFVPPPSGSVMITAQSAPSGIPSNADKNIDLQIAIWEPIMGEHLQQPNCADPRYLWTPIVSRNHGLLDYEDSDLLGIFDTYYNIVDTKNNILFTKGNSLIATCLDPGKLYYIQVDGTDYFLCDFLNGGDCTMGYFSMQVTDAGLYDMASMRDQPAGNDEPCGAKTLNVQPYNRTEAQLTWQVGSNLCASGFNDPLPSTWNSTDATVWYKFTAPASGRVKIRAKENGRINRRDKSNPNSPNAQLATSNHDYHDGINLQLALYTMGNCLNKSSLVEITSSYDGALVEMNPANEDDFIGLTEITGRDEYMVARCLIPGKEYYIMVDGENDPTIGYTSTIQEILPNSIKYVTGDFKISVQDDSPIEVSMNDNVCDAFEITGVNTLGVNSTKTTGIFNNDCATIEPHIEGHGKIAEKIKGKFWGIVNTSPATANHTLWFKFRAPSSGKVNIKAINDNRDKMDIAMALYDFPGENCNLAADGFMIEGNYDPGVLRGDAEMDVECLIPGRYYYLQVFGESNNVLCTLGGSNCERGLFHLEIKHLPFQARSDIPPQKNDNVCDATLLGNLNPGGVLNKPSQNNRCSTEEINEPGGYGFNFSFFDDQLRGVWYGFKTGAGSNHPGQITIEVTNPSHACLNLHVELFEYKGAFDKTTCESQTNLNTQFNKLLKVGKGSAFLTRSEKLVLDCPKPNTEYFIRVTGTASATCFGFGDTQGDFDLKVSMSGVSISSPENDDICDATQGGNKGNLGTLPSGGTKSVSNHNNICATQELGEPNTTQSAVQSEPEYDETTWYKFRTSANPGKITIRLKTIAPIDGSATVPSFTVYKGSSANYSPCGNAGFSGLIDLGGDWSSNTSLGSFTIRDGVLVLPCPSPNWNYFIQVDGYDFALLGVTIPGYTSQFVYDLIVTDDGSENIYPENDNIADAIPVDDVPPLNGQLASGGTLTIAGHNLCATVESGEPNVDSDVSDHQKSAEDETVWYYFITPANPGVTKITVKKDPAYPEPLSPNFTLYYNNGTAPTYARITEAPSSKLVQEGNSGNNTGLGATATANYTCLLPNTKYYIQVDGYDNVPTRTDQGHFIVTVEDDGTGTDVPANQYYDLICRAQNITNDIVNNGGVTLLRTNKCSWEEIDEPNTSQGIEVTKTGIDAYDNTVWFKFQPKIDGEFTFDITTKAGAINYHRFTLYNAPSGSFNCANPNWNNLTRMSMFNVNSNVNNNTFGCLLKDQWYYIQVKGRAGDFDLKITHSAKSALDHDMVCQAWDFGTVENTTASVGNQNNSCATQELGEPGINGNYNDINSSNYDRTLWYKFRTPAQIGDWEISVTNQSPFNDRISATFTLYEATKANICSGANPVWTNLNKKDQPGLPINLTGDNSLEIECYKLKPNTWYFIQVHGNDAWPFGDVGTNFQVSVKHTPKLAGGNDNVCSPEILSFGDDPYADNNYCATSQYGEIDIDPWPEQDPFRDGRNYDETMWYRFRAPAQGYVNIIATSNNLHMEMDLYEISNGSTICAGGQPQWNKLLKIGSEKSSLLNRNISLKSDCLLPGKWYLIRIDGRDGITFDDRGDYTIQVINEYEAQPVVCNPVPNDDPCNLPSAYDLSDYVLENPCPTNSMNYIGSYVISTSTNPRIDCATRSPFGSPCGGMNNCSDYWYKFTVPMDSEGGVRIQGNDEYGASNGNNSTQVVAAYRGDPCTGQLQYLGCDYGGSSILDKDVEFDIAAIPGETIYIQVFNDDAPSNPNYSTFGLCLSTRCEPKTDCGVTELTYEVPQCWNLDDKNTPGNNGLYGKCLPGSVKSENYFTFKTECGATSDGEPDTVTIVFSITDVSSNTALAIYEDATPCDGLEESTVINCVPFGNCVGCSPITTFSQTYRLEECKSYVIQVVGEKDGDDGSSGQIYVFKSSNQPPVLPVELVSFTGYYDGTNNILNWNTASEENTDQFIIEKSPDGEHFSAIGIVGAAGNSGEIQKYSFVDEDARIGNNYYRLRIVDFDGKYEFSNVINIEVDGTVKKTEQNTSVLSIYPNPTDNKTKVEMYVSEKHADFEVKVVNILGQILHSEMISFSRGNVSFEIDASKYAQGEYIISITNKNSYESWNTKFIKQ